MFRKTSIISAVALVAMVIPTVASATGGYVPTTGKQLVQIVKDRKANTTYKTHRKPPVHTQASIGSALTFIAGSVNRNSQERAGYCAPIPMPRVGENDGLFLNLYADAESRSLYLAAGLVDARKDAVTGSLSC